jgi:DNA-binding transcriptional regulator YhcF (GntR family)
MSEVAEFRSKPGTYVKLRHAFLRSPAWQSLSALARAIYVDIAARHNGRNNGQIPYSARDGAKALRVAKDTAHRALLLLEARGLIRCARRGSFNDKSQSAKSSLWELPEYIPLKEQTEECLVRLEGPARMRDAYPGPTTGTSDQPAWSDERDIKKNKVKVESFSAASQAGPSAPKQENQDPKSEEAVFLQNPLKSGSAWQPAGSAQWRREEADDDEAILERYRAAAAGGADR